MKDWKDLLNKINEESNKNQKEYIKNMDLILKKIEECLTSPDYNTLNVENGIDDMIVIDDKMTIYLTTPENQKKKINNNETLIDLGKCQQVLINHYNIINEKLFIKKIVVNQEGMKIPKIEYDIYSKLSNQYLKILDKSLCENEEITLSVPVSLTESIEKLNSSSDYYNDICYTVKTDIGTDLSFKDRKEEFVNGNKTLCQDECKLSEYDYDIKRAKCLCKVKATSLSFANMTIDIKKLYENFIDIENIANINILKCNKVLFTKKGIISNVGFYVILVILIIHIIFIFIFYKKQIKVLNKKIKDIIFGIKNYKLIDPDNKEDKKRDKKNRTLLNNNDRTSKTSKYIKKAINKKKKFKNKKNEPPKKKGNENNNYKEKKDYLVLNKNVKSHKKSIDKGDNNSIKKRNSNLLSKRNKRNTEQINSDNTRQRMATTTPNQKQDIINKVIDSMKYSDSEMNELSYELALQFDKRTYCAYYLSLLRTKHNLIFSFYNVDDYNSSIIKKDLFFFGFTVLYTINALFYNDDTIYEINKNEGSFDFIYKLPTIIYSSLISTVINIIVKLLALSNKDIVRFKENKSLNDINKRVNDLKCKLKAKFILYFIISTIFLIFFLYYLSMFCVIYRNTQYQLIIDTVISFGLSLIYPFGIYLFPGIFRIPSLANRRIKRKCMYRISKFLQIF